jgi:peptidoglycan hydrolase-like protein with peptidoglycan-binding domain
VLNALFVVALAFIGASPLFAQSDRSQSLLFPGNAVVTGFSGTTSLYKESELPENSTLADETFIDLNGSPVRVFDLEASVRADDALLPNSPQTYEFSARDVGQVFGLALDDRKLPDGNAPAPNIYVTATSAYGLHLVAPDADGDGLPERVKRGGQGVNWMDGQFGLEKAGGPGSIWKIDGVSGDISLFADLKTDGVANSGPGLGNIVFDATHRQFFVTDRDTGLIHRLDMSGQDLGVFDHGVDGRAVQNLAPVTFDSANRADISSDKFHSDDPATWGYAALQRRTWGLALHQGRLYYAVAEGPQIWSLAINNDGSFGTPRWELDLPGDFEPYEVSDIEFTGRGRMVLAQRGQVTGAYDYLTPIKSDGARVLRYRLERPDDPATASRWSSEPEEYAVGQTGDYRNSDGGLALGFGFTRQGTFNYRACQATLWATGDGLRQVTRRTIAPRQAAARDETQFLNGLQGNAVTLVRPENAPPKLARFVDFSGAYSTERTRGWIGDIAIPVVCQPQDPYVPPPALPPLPPAQNALDLAIDKQQIGACTIGGICRFRISVRNVNSAAYRGPLLIRDEISQAGMALVGYGALPWTCSQVGKEVSCKRPEVLLWPGRQVNLWVDFQLKAKILIPGWRNCAAITWAGNRNSEPTVRAVQMELSDLGFYAGPIDGALTPATRTAIGDFQVAAGLPATGEVTPDVLELLFGPGAHRVGDANPLNDRDCADVAFIAGPLPGPGPDPLPEIAALDVSIGGQAECPFGQECAFGLTIRNKLPIPFDQQVDGVVELNRLGVAVAEQTALTPSFCAGPVGQMDIDCRFRLQLAPNQARSYPMRLNIQNALLDPADAANQAPDGKVRADICFGVEEPGWFGWLFGQEYDRDCHKFVVPAAPALPAGAEITLSKTGPATCLFGKTCEFRGAIWNTGNVAISGKFNLVDKLYVPVVDQRLNANHTRGTFISTPNPLCTPGLPGMSCGLDFNAQPLGPGEIRQFKVTIGSDALSAADFDPAGEPNRRYDARNCFEFKRDGNGQVIAEDCHSFGIIADDNAPQAGIDLRINAETAGAAFCIKGENCKLNVFMGNGGPDDYEGDLKFNITANDGVTFTSFGSQLVWNCQPAADPRTVNCTWTGRGRRIAADPFRFERRIELEYAISPDYQLPTAEFTAILDQAILAGDVDPSNNIDPLIVPILEVAPMPIEDAPADEPPLQLAENLAITKTARKQNCKLEMPCLFDITLKNNGAATTGDRIRFVETFPQGIRSETITSSDGALGCARAEPGRFVCSGTGDLNVAAGQEFKFEATFAALADNRAAGLENCVTLDKDGDGVADADETKSCAQVKILLNDGDEPRGPGEVADITITNRAVNTTCKPGTGCWFNIVVRNNGRTDFSDEIELRNVASISGTSLDWPIEFGSRGRWQCEPASNRDENSVCKAVGLSAGETLSLPVKVQIPDVGALPIPIFNQRILTECASIQFDGQRKEACSGANLDITNTLDTLVVEKLAEATCQEGRHCDFYIRLYAKGERGYVQNFTLIDQARKIGGTQLRMPITGGGPGCATPPTHVPFTCRRRLSLPPFQGGIGRAVLGLGDNSTSVVTQFGYRVKLPDELKAGDRIENCFQLLFTFEGKSYRPVTCTTVKIVAAGEELDTNTQDLTPEDNAPDGPRDPIAGRFGPQLSVSKVAGSRRCEAGKECSFAITVANNGVVPYQGPLVVSEQMTPQNARLLRTTPSPWNCNGSNGRLTCRHPSLSLGIGESKRVRLTFRMPARAGADIRNCANFVWRGPTFNGRTAAAKQALRAHGFKPGAPNATITSQTQRAIRRFQRQQNMRVTGTINPAVMKALIRSWGVGDQNAADDSSCVTAAFIRAPQTSDPTPVDPGPVVTPRPCPRGQQRVDGRCVPICGGGQSLVRGKCVCPSGQVFDRKLNRCRVGCASGTVFDGKQCVTRCPEAERWNGKQCVNRCAAGQRWNARRNRCVSQCSSGQRWNGKQCVNRCQSSQRWNGKQCVNRCSAGQRWTGRQCVSSCTGGKVFDAKRNRCVCPSGQTEVRGKCLRLQTTPGGQTITPGQSTVRPIPRCTGGKVYDAKRRSCVCPAGRVEIRGNCVFVQIKPNGGPSMTINPNLVKPR